MKIMKNDEYTPAVEGRLIPAETMPEGKERPAPPMPPHLRRNRMSVCFDEEDWSIMQLIFGDADTASSAARSISNAPPEIQILAVQTMEEIRKKIQKEVA